MTLTTLKVSDAGYNARDVPIFLEFWPHASLVIIYSFALLLYS